ncbi:DUF3460 family protein [Zwartia panacis]|jgi:hypothetical protein|uniref:DUF3460 family protein n=1 Tax=Zwartia panacis TaxID=2683345 RepID=UPI0025B4094A|nr:DUF3460 family protein [Zwartia panacis]MDN4016266.1 DUF3460 family protein [Zwartia panacis]
MADQYTSEITQFLQKFKTEHPDIEQRQRDGRARLWDRPQDSELAEGFKQARVRQNPYVYQNN